MQASTKNIIQANKLIYCPRSATGNRIPQEIRTTLKRMNDININMSDDTNTEYFESHSNYDTTPKF